MSGEKVIFLTSQEAFAKYVAEQLEAINQWEDLIMADIEEIKTALAGVKSGMTDVSASILNISKDQQALLDKITALEAAAASGTVVSAQDMADLKQQATDLKSQTDLLSGFAKGVADAVPDQPP